MNDAVPALDAHAPGPPPRGGPGRRISRFLHAHRGVRLGISLAPPLGWLLVVYIGSLAALLVTSLYTLGGPFRNVIVEDISFDNFRNIWENDIYRTVTLRTLTVAAAVTVIDAFIAVPAAFFIAKVVRPSFRKFLVVAVLMPLWASYLVKAYAWRAILAGGGVLDETFGRSPGFGLSATVVVLAYLWLPYMVLPIYAGLERLPDSLLEASSDMGAKSLRTFRSVVLPTIWPAVAAGSIFTFSLTMGDYIAVGLVGGTTQMLGNQIEDFFGVPNLPFAAALATLPVVIMLFYLFAIRRSGALDSL